MWKQNYLPFGKQRVGIPNNTSTNATRNQAFGGKSYDGLTGLSYFGARYYDPVIGRFMAVDPVGPDPEGNIHSLNRYTYANNNPYKYVDPDGRVAFLVPIAWTAARFVATEIAAAVIAEVTPVDIPLSKKGLLQKAVRDGARNWPGSVVQDAAKAGLTPGKVRSYLGEVNNIPRDQLVNDLKKSGLNIKGQSSDGRFMEFVDKSGNVRAKVHPSDRVTNYNHLHIYNKQGVPLNNKLEQVDRRSPDAHLEIE